jgi:hypothetical protein
VPGDVNLAKALSGVERECSASLAWNSSLTVWLKLLIYSDEIWIDPLPDCKSYPIRFSKQVYYIESYSKTIYLSYLQNLLR